MVKNMYLYTKFNSCVKKINTPKNNDNMKIFHVNICDYVYGLKKDKYNDILYILNNIAKSSTNFSCHNNEIGLTYDEHLLSHVKDILNYNYATHYIHIYQICRIYKISKFHLFDKGKQRQNLLMKIYRIILYCYYIKEYLKTKYFIYKQEMNEINISMYFYLLYKCFIKESFYE